MAPTLHCYRDLGPHDVLASYQRLHRTASETIASLGWVATAEQNRPIVACAATFSDETAAILRESGRYLANEYGRDPRSKHDPWVATMHGTARSVRPSAFCSDAR